MGQELQLIKQGLSPKGGTFAREFRRTRNDDRLDWNVEKAYALEMISNNDQLQRCTPESVARSLIDVGVLGLTLSPTMRLAYLIPYKDNCTVSPSYMGLEQIAYKTGFVEMIQTVLVCKNDPEFNVWTDELGRHIMHMEAAGNRGEVTHAYCLAWFSSGRKHVEVMDREDIMACRDAATKKNFGKVPFTWKGAFKHEMYKKSVMRRGWKHWPRVDNPRIAEMMSAVERSDPLDFKESSVVVEKDTISQSQIDELIKMMTDAGINDRSVDAWLKGLSSKLGYTQGIRTVKAHDFDAAASLMEEGLRQWKEKSKSKHPESGSKQENTTAQTVET